MSLRGSFTIKSVDFRSLLGVTAPTFSEMVKKFNVSFPSDTPHQGTSKQIMGPDIRNILEARGYQYPKPAKVISFLMCKGGVGKTTSSFFLAQRLSAYGAWVLAVDADSQGNLTSAFNLDQFGIELDAETPILIDAITEKCSITDAIIEVTPNLHLIPSTPLNANLEARIREKFKNPSLPIKQILDPLLGVYDFILIDCAPALNLVNTSVTCASDTLILPVAPDKFSQLGLEQTLNEISQIERDFNISVQKRIIFTKFDAREFTSLQYLADTATRHRDKSFNTAIRICADVKNVITKREDLFLLKRSNAKEDYDSFAREIMGLDKPVRKSRPRTDNQ